jgi:hypothetical protein
MATEYTVGLRLETRSEVLTIEAEDALIAALKAKHEHPEAAITYVRKSNRRGDRRHPHGGLSEKAKNKNRFAAAETWAARLPRQIRSSPASIFRKDFLARARCSTCSVDAIHALTPRRYTGRSVNSGARNIITRGSRNLGVS